MSNLPKPTTTRDIYLNAIATGVTSGLPEPITKRDAYLKQIAEKGLSAGSGVSSVTSENITDATEIGKTLITAPNKTVVQQTVSPNADVVALLSGTLNESNKTNVRTLIGAGTSNLEIGTTSDKAKAGDYVPVWDEITSKPSTFTPPTATTSAIGGVKQAETQSDSVAEDVSTLVTDFNALLAKLKAAGIMA